MKFEKEGCGSLRATEPIILIGFFCSCGESNAYAPNADPQPGPSLKMSTGHFLDARPSYGYFLGNDHLELPLFGLMFLTRWCSRI